jgi:hypothetical protein
MDMNMKYMDMIMDMVRLGVILIQGTMEAAI